MYRRLAELERRIETGDYPSIIPHAQLYRRLYGIADKRHYVEERRYEEIPLPYLRRRPSIYMGGDYFADFVFGRYKVKFKFNGMVSIDRIRMSSNYFEVCDDRICYGDKIVEGIRRWHTPICSDKHIEFIKNYIFDNIEAVTSFFIKRFETEIKKIYALTRLINLDKEYFSSKGIHDLINYRYQLKNEMNAQGIKAEEVGVLHFKKDSGEEFPLNGCEFKLTSQNSDFMTYMVEFFRSGGRKTIVGIFSINTMDFLYGDNGGDNDSFSKEDYDKVAGVIIAKINPVLERMRKVAEKKAVARIISHSEKYDHICAAYLKGLRFLESFRSGNKVEIYDFRELHGRRDY